MSEQLPIDVISVGGNALWNPDDPRVEVQRDVCTHVCEMIGERVKGGKRGTVITHGNGPHVGFMMSRVEAGLAEGIHDVPLYALVADTQSAIGLMLQQKIRSALLGVNFVGDLQQTLERAARVVTITTEVVVDPKSAAFQRPTKPVGVWMSWEQVLEHQSREGSGFVAQQIGYKEKNWRRVVPSPEPTAIVEFEAIKENVLAGRVVICCGGGGVPISVSHCSHTGRATFTPHDAVIDKDSTTALLAAQLHAETMIVYTAHDGVSWPEDFRISGENAPIISKIGWKEANARLVPVLPKGSMGPKVSACANFVGALARQGKSAKAVICGPKTVEDVLLRHDFSGCTQIY